MDEYKKVFKTKKTRDFVLGLFRFVPDKMMLKWQYKIKLGKRLNLKNPNCFTEKIQYYKLFYRNPVLHKCVDKYLVREYVKEKGLENILVPLIAKYNNATEICIDDLPNEFVLKTTNGGGGLNVVICRDKSVFNFASVKDKLQCKKIKTRTGGREWAYYGLKPGIVAEQLLINEDNPDSGVNDYKIFCYNGKPKYIVVDVDRYILHKRNFYDLEWQNLKIGSDCPASDREIPKPDGFNEMLDIASKLSEGFPFVRVDLYNVKGKIYFGELTFYPWSGYVEFEPIEADALLGQDLSLSDMNQSFKGKLNG